MALAQVQRYVLRIYLLNQINFGLNLNIDLNLNFVWLISKFVVPYCNTLISYEHFYVTFIPFSQMVTAR